MPIKKQKKKKINTENNFQKYINEINLMNKKVAILSEVARVTSRDFNLNKILGKFLDIIIEALNADAGSILLVDKISDTLYFAVARGSKADKLKDYKLSIGEGIAGWVAQTGKSLITPNVTKDKRFAAKISKEINYPTKNIICAPLKFEEEVLGVIELINKKGKSVFNENDLEILEVFTPYIGVIIKNAQLFIENNKKIERLEHLIEITKFVNSTLNLGSLLDRMLEISTNVLNAEAGSILLLDEDKDELVFAAATGEKSDKIKEIRVPIGEGVVGWVAREDKPALIADAQNDPRFFKKADQKTKFKTKTIIAVPLKTKDKLIGVIEVLNKKDDTLFNEEDVNLLFALANQAAVAIENAKLYENLKGLFLNTVKSLATAIETKDIYTRGHSERVTQYSLLIAKKLGLKNDEQEDLRLAALLHDIGKIGIDESILRKPAKLTNTEFEEIKKHPIFAANILSSIPQLKEIIPAIKHHHERYDGNGYPDELKGKDIPYFSRIIAIADTFDAMSSNRPYRQALPVDVCLQEILNCSGTQFDPDLAVLAHNALKEYFNTKKLKE